MACRGRRIGLACSPLSRRALVLFEAVLVELIVGAQPQHEREEHRGLFERRELDYRFDRRPVCFENEGVHETPLECASDRRGPAKLAAGDARVPVV